ncbi:Peroxidase [Musa troglodytarum]|uniref:Peroxidase 1 n=1 Tax=Musa troglodytarum TaxID=320322 RepID=A0A9E7LEL1_9LILI|nr:Peroxidase [Musa troglodytarum]
MKPWLASGLLMSGSALLLRLHVTVKLRAIMELDSACSSEQLACHYKYRSISSLPSHLDSILRLYTYSVAMAGSVESFLKLCCLFCLVATSSGQLSPAFYSRTCPTLQTIVSLTMRTTVLLDPRMGASLLRLFFHDCFVNGCDASVLLDDTATFTGEKNAGPNANSLRGFDVIDTIKTAVELLCPGTVSCADILALAARDGVALLGGPSWTVALGRRDATTASQSAANSNLPGPGSSLSQLIAAFAAKGLNARDMTALSGAHTIGQARCVNFRSHIYNDANVDAGFASQRQRNCPSSGGDNNLAPLDVQTPNTFDNAYFRNLIAFRGLLHSDQELFNNGTQDALVQQYSTNAGAFAADFAAAMVRMGNISPLTGSSGEIRSACRRPWRFLWKASSNSAASSASWLLQGGSCRLRSTVGRAQLCRLS